MIDAPADVRVQAVGADGELASETYAGPRGQFKFEPLPPGEYHLQVLDARGHRLALSGDSQTDVRGGGQAGRFEVVLRLAIPAVPQVGPPPGNARAAGTGQITGTVTAAAGGALLQSVSVYAYTSKTAALYDYAAYDYTGADGKYALTGLADGSYYLRFEKTDYLTSYYNGRASLAEADAVSVTLGGVTGNINAALILGGKITGTVTAAAGGALLQDVTVYAYTSKTADTYDYVAYDYTASDGVYWLSGLAAGTYYLRFAKTDYFTVYYNAKATLAEADGVSVTLGGTTGNINAALVLGGKITGTVTAAAGGALLQSVSVYAYTSKTADTYDYMAYDYTGADGVYSLGGLTAGHLLS